MPPATPQTDPAAAPAPNPANPPSAPPTTLPIAMTQPNIPANVQIPGLDQNQLMSLLRQLPGVFKFSDSPQGGTPKEDAAQTLSNLAQAPFPQGAQHPLGIPHPYPGPTGLGINDPGPSSHPRGPPNLGQLSAVAMQAAPAAVAARPAGQLTPGQVAPGQGEEVDNADGPPSSPPMSGEKLVAALAGRTRGRNPAMGTDEWTRQRKDNHKEVERRRRGNINEGINELGRIVPNGSGEKAKGAILARAVQYIHHLKDNEARNIEKWTLEKLLMDQAMGDLQAQLEEVKRLWEEERAARSRAETELEMLRGLHGVTGATKAPAASGESSAAENSNKRRSEDLAEGEGGERSDKKARTE